MTLEDEQRLSSSSQSSTPSNTVDVENVRNTQSNPEESNQLNSEQSTLTTQNQTELTTTEEIRTNNQTESQSDQQDDSNIDQLQHYISQIHFDSTTGRHQIPPELLAEDQDLLESEFQTLDNDIDVIEMYVNRLNEQANDLQEKLRNLLQNIIQEDNFSSSDIATTKTN